MGDLSSLAMIGQNGSSIPNLYFHGMVFISYILYVRKDETTCDACTNIYVYDNYVCLYIHVFIYVHVCTVSTNIRTYMYVHVHVLTYTYYIHNYNCIHTYTGLLSKTYNYVCTCTCMSFIHEI